MNAFTAATLVPIPSEPLLVAMMASGAHATLLLVAVATLGNTLGSVVNWAMGRFLLRYRDRRWFPASEVQLQRAADQFRRYGLWALLLAWVPVIGDALTVGAGLLRVNLGWFTLLVGVGKALRYLAVAWAAGFALA